MHLFMPELPVFTMKKERRELVELMSIPFKCEPNYNQTKMSFVSFVSEMAAPTLLHSLSMIRG
jgi:hypothetical protein